LYSYRICYIRATQFDIIFYKECLTD